jgi:hypothetical protein
MTDVVNHPKHYTQHPSGLEAIEICEHLSFNIGNAVKYCWRAGLKGQDATEDLRKALWYLKREERRNAIRNFVPMRKEEWADIRPMADQSAAVARYLMGKVSDADCADAGGPGLLHRLFTKISLPTWIDLVSAEIALRSQP